MKGIKRAHFSGQDQSSIKSCQITVIVASKTRLFKPIIGGLDCIKEEEKKKVESKSKGRKIEVVEVEKFGRRGRKLRVRGVA